MKITKRNESRENFELPAVKNPFGGTFSLRDAMDRLFDESFWSPLGFTRADQRVSAAAFVPRVDVSETDTEVKVRADIPGIDPEKVNIEVTEDSLAISGSIEKSNEERSENFYRMERQMGQFSREFILPSKVDPDAVEAKAKNGVITIALKKQPSEQKRKVRITSA